MLDPVVASTAGSLRVNDEPRIAVNKDGPLTVTGEVALVRLAGAPEGEWRIEETLPPRAAYTLCRCGLSRMAPFCDYKHMRDFDGTETADSGVSESAEASEAPPAIGFVRGEGRTLVGPLWVRGAVALVSADSAPYPSRGEIALCRCGRSGSKPYCDGSHEKGGA